MNKNINNSSRKRIKDVKRYSVKSSRNCSQHVKRPATTLIIGEIHMKTVPTYHFSSIKLTKN